MSEVHRNPWVAELARSHWEDVEEPQPDDLAWHISEELDPRSVTDVVYGSDGKAVQVYLYILGKPAGPFPAANYRFTRKMKNEGEEA